MRALADSYRICLMCTVAQSPWSNAMCERFNHILNLNVRKIIDDVGCPVTVAFEWPVAASK